MELAENYLDKSRQVGDIDADTVVIELMKAGQKDDLYTFFKAKSINDPDLKSIKSEQLLHFVNEEYDHPDWADKQLMEKGAAFFRQNSNEFLFMLGIVSLPYCYAGANGAKVLYQSDKIRKNTHLRLLDTTSFVLDMMKPGAFHEKGNATFIIKQVRLRHALSRYFLSKDPEMLELKETPINQEDMAGTNLAFSYIILKTLPKIGVIPDIEEKLAYLHLWKVIGYWMGIHEKLLPKSVLEAYQLEKRISQRHFRKSKAGKELTQQLIEYYEKEIPNSATVFLIKPLMRHLLGNNISDIIGIEPAFIPGIQSIMRLLPFFKKFIFPPNEDYEKVRSLVEQQRSNLAS